MNNSLVDVANNGTSEPPVHGRVHVRVPTYRRPHDLARALRSVMAQSWTEWICTIYDDDPDQSANAVYAALGDPRLIYRHNLVQKFASGNIDQCFARPAADDDSEYFCVLEDDNQLLPAFMADNIRAMTQAGTRVVLRNQWFDHADRAAGSGRTTLGDVFTGGVYEAALFRASSMIAIGISNGGLFWSRQAQSDFRIGDGFTAVIQEYLRTWAVADDVYVAIEPLAIFAADEAATTRHLGDRRSARQLEIDQFATIQRLRRDIWKKLPKDLRREVQSGDRFVIPRDRREAALAGALLASPPILLRRDGVRLLARAIRSRLIGRVPSELGSVVGRHDRSSTRQYPPVAVLQEKGSL